MPSSAHWQPAGYSHFGQTTANDYWGGTQPWHESSDYDFKNSGEEEKQENDQGWDHDNWHESQPSEPGSFSWTEYEASWQQAEEERIKAEKEREEKADAERHKRRKERRAERDKEHKRRKIARVPGKQKKLSEKIIALDEEITRLKAVLGRSTLTDEAEQGCFPDEEGSDTVDHFSIKLNHYGRVLTKAISIHHNLCRVQRVNGLADEAETAEQELAKAREVLALRLEHELARDNQEQKAGCASSRNPAAFKTLEVDDDEECLRMLRQRYQSSQEKELELQEQYHRNDSASGDRKPNGKRATVEHSDTQGTWSGEHNKHDPSFKLQQQADLGGKPYRKPLRHQRIYNWLDQVVSDEDNEAKNTEHPDSPTRSTQASHPLVDDNSETPIPPQEPYSSPSQGPRNIMNSEPEPLVSSLTADPLVFDADHIMPNYLQTVHRAHLEVHSEFWDFVADDGVNCDFCGFVPSVLQCPNCTARACSACKANPAGKSYPDPKNGHREEQHATEAYSFSFTKGKGLSGRY